MSDSNIDKIVEQVRMEWIGGSLRVERVARRAAELAVAEERERCMAAIREQCQVCEGTGIGGHTGSVIYDDDGCVVLDTRCPTECEYCGRPMAAIRAGKEVGSETH